MQELGKFHAKSIKYYSVDLANVENAHNCGNVLADWLSIIPRAVPGHVQVAEEKSCRVTVNVHDIEIILLPQKTPWKNTKNVKKPLIFSRECWSREISGDLLEYHEHGRDDVSILPVLFFS